MISTLRYFSTPNFISLTLLCACLNLFEFAFNLPTNLKIYQGQTKVILRNILKENRKALIRLAQALLEYETLESNEVEAIIKGETIRQAEKQGEPPKSSPDSNQKEIKEDAKQVGPMVNPSERPATA